MKNILLSLILGFSATAFSQEKLEPTLQEQISNIEAIEDKCLEKEEFVSTYGMRECFSATYHALDKILNREYSAIIKELKQPKDDPMDIEANAATLKSLQESQRAWVKFRDTNVVFAGTSNYGGTSSLIEMDSKAVQMLKDRILEIDSIYYGPEDLD